jgi:hypothetical protein
MDQTFYGSDFGQLNRQDPEIAAVLLSELDRVRGGLQLIASENFTSPAVLAALGSTLSNKYAEGYPGRRYYGGCSEVDKAESLAIARAKKRCVVPISVLARNKVRKLCVQYRHRRQGHGIKRSHLLRRCGNHCHPPRRGLWRRADDGQVSS